MIMMNDTEDKPVGKIEELFRYMIYTEDMSVWIIDGLTLQIHELCERCACLDNLGPIS